jgi:hypothetical protein
MKKGGPFWTALSLLNYYFVVVVPCFLLRLHVRTDDLHTDERALVVLH